MTQPSSNSVNVHTGSEEVGRSRVADRVGTHTFLSHGREFRCHVRGVAFDQRVNPESREWLTAAVEEDMLGWGSVVNQRTQFINRLLPQRTATELVSLSAQDNR